jgi:tetratricopeptide (TPR) repeat protein
MAVSKKLALALLALSFLAVTQNGCEKKSNEKARPVNAEAEAYRKQALAFFDERRQAEGLEALRQAILLDPQEAWPYNYVWFLCFVHLKQRDQGIAIYEESVKDKPDNDLGFYFLAEAYIGQLRYEEAMRAYKELARIQPDDANIRYELGSLYLMVGDEKGAIKEHEALLDLSAASMFFSYDRKFYSRRAEQLLEEIKTGNIILSRRPEGCVNPPEF